MTTPICDFVEKYSKKNTVRLHMPGHKGRGFLGVETIDITEIDGADVLYSPNGIIAQSQENAAKLFGTKKTIYSCEGSSLSIKAMLYLAILAYNTQNKTQKTVVAVRNAHKSFLNAAALLDLNIEWLYAEDSCVISGCKVLPEQLDKKLSEMSQKPIAFYITSPDYLGNIADIEGLSKICDKHKVLFICDNAHGSYRNFLTKSKHPLRCGVDICCDSAHKTLPVLTGGGYLHISKKASDILAENAQRAMDLFASTSPSYLILQSLDKVNDYLLNGYTKDLNTCVKRISLLKDRLKAVGFSVVGEEELKITIAPKSYGYTGREVAQYLLNKNIVCEFSDWDYLVLMFSTEISEKEIIKVEEALLNLPCREAIDCFAPKITKAKKIMSIRKAMFSKGEWLPIDQCEGKILAAPSVSCPPAIPIISCGEEIDRLTINLFKYYGIKEVFVVKQ